MQIKESLKKADYLNEFKVKLISMTSHQFNAPLSNIKISMELCKMLLNKDMNVVDIEHITNLLSDVISEADKISDLIGDILNVSMADEVKIEYHPSLVSVNSFVMDYMLTDGRKIAGDREVYLSLCPDDAVVFIDVKLMYQVIENIVGNAIKYSSGNDPVEIVTKHVSDKVLLEVNDLGIGIPPDDIPFLFQQFFRSKNVGQISGTGIGLSIVKTYVELNNGAVKIENRPDKGTSVKIYLPKFSQ